MLLCKQGDGVFLNECLNYTKNKIKNLTLNYQTSQRRKEKIINMGICITHEKTVENLSIGVTNFWIVELRRILCKITKSNTFQIRPFFKKKKNTLSDSSTVKI